MQQGAKSGIGPSLGPRHLRGVEPGRKVKSGSRRGPGSAGGGRDLYRHRDLGNKAPRWEPNGHRSADSGTGFAADGHIRKYDGEPFAPHHIVDGVNAQVNGETDKYIPYQEITV